MNARLPVKDQLLMNMENIGKKYGAARFIAYFQSFSCTYMDPEVFSDYIHDAIIDGIVAVYVSTRPDCITAAHLDVLQRVMEKGIDVVVELGLQSANDKTLRFLNRGHTVADFIHASEELHRRGIRTCAHILSDIPNDSMEDVLRCAGLFNELGTHQVKCHSVYILKDTKLGQLYKANLFQPLGIHAWMERTIAFLERLSSDKVIQRLIGRAPEERTLYANFGMSWWKAQSFLEEKMTREGAYQGRLYAQN